MIKEYCIDDEKFTCEFGVEKEVKQFEGATTCKKFETHEL